MVDVNPYRLPRTVEPARYELTLTPDIEAKRFTGEERVQLTVHEATREIRLNSAELEIFSAELTSVDGVKLSGTTTFDEPTEVAIIALSDVAEPGEWVLHLTFAGTLNDKLRGFYRSTYVDDAGVEQTIATTQFEATDARRAFPCWDEPDFKAVFSATLIVEEGLTALSNAAEVERTPLGNGKIQIEFADTMKMSTYLVAFVVGKLVVTEPVDVDGTPLRIVCVPGREHLTDFAIEAGVAALRYFAEYFKIPYPGDKVDMIALPDFAAGAMENLGCITFRETALLVDLERASRLEVQRVADVIAHELAHMWFGDLVTMKWWNGIWLNEAFATFMELLFVDHFRPNWERWVTAGVEASAAMNIDSLSSTRPIEFEVTNPDEARGMFDLLTYQKGAGVLRMLEQHIGPGEFTNGIATYLRDHAYGNAETTDLWDALEASSSQPVRSMMDSWIFQGGHPLVRAELTAGGTGLTLTQHRFRYLNDASDTARWHIPVSVRAMIDNEMHQQKVLFNDEQITIELPGKPEWLVVNEHANGFYRVSYESGLLRRLVENVHALDSLERYSLANDTWAACLTGLVELEDFVGLVEQMKGDDDPNVWMALLGPLRLLDNSLDDATRPHLQAFVRSVVQPAHERLGWDPRPGESERLATLRGTVIGALGTLGADLATQQEAIERYTAYQKDSSALDANLVSAVQVTLAATNDAAHYETLWSRFSSASSTPQEQVGALQALACFTAPALVSQTLNAVKNGEVRTQDAPFAVRMLLMRNITAANQAWQWCEENWDDICERFPENTIGRIVEGATAQTNPEFAERVRTFMAEHPVPQAHLSVEQTRERLAVNIAFHQRNAHKLPSLFD